MALPTSLLLEVVTPEGLLLKEQVDEVIAPGDDGYFGVLPGHTPMLAALGLGEISFRRGAAWSHLASFGGFSEVLPDKVSILARIGERADEIDLGRAEAALRRAQERMQAVRDEQGFEDAHQAYVRAVTRLAVARRQR
jgi:F-type H+-transporting ATPase subunit epsilon